MCDSIVMVKKRTKSEQIQDFIKRNGLKTAWIASKLDMSEELLRYHINRGMSSGDLMERFCGVIENHCSSLLSDLLFIRSL